MRKIIIKIMGMDCAACAPHVKELIQSLSGVTQVQMNFLAGQAQIQVEESEFSLDRLEKVLARAGYQIPLERVKLQTNDRQSVQNLEEECKKEIFGMKAFEQSEEGELYALIYPIQMSGSVLLKWFQNHGVEIEIEEWSSGEEEVLQKEQISLLKNLVLAVLLSTPILWNPSPYIQLVLATLLQLFPGRVFYKGLVRAVKTRQWNMDSLMSFSTTTIYAYSTYITLTQQTQIKLYFLCEGVLISLVLFGRYLEFIAKGETSQALRRLLCFLPRRACILKNGETSYKDIDEVQINDLVLVDSGERIPVDGTIESGACFVDESVMTGESIPIRKTAGDTCIGGTLNRQGKVVIRVCSKNEDSALQHMITIVRRAQISAAPIQKFADRIAGIFIPFVLGIAVGVFFLWYLWLDAGNVEQAVMTACGVLVVACPCALSLATPTSIMVGTGRACELGILFKNATSIETLCKIDKIAFDKTGTLTLGGEDINRNELRSEVMPAIQELQKHNVTLCMISGDQQTIVRKIAKKAGIQQVLSQVTPEGKADAIRQMQQAGNHVAMVGDGVNDAPAMAVSELGISLENGTEIARDAADIIILKDDIGKISLAMDMAKGIMRNIYGNLAWALCYNIVCIPLAACGIMNPSIASAAMSFSSIAVLLHALRLKKLCSR